MKWQKLDAVFQFNLPAEKRSGVALSIKDISYFHSAEARGESRHRTIVEPVVENRIRLLRVHPDGRISKLGVAGFNRVQDHAGPGIDSLRTRFLVLSISKRRLA